VSHRDEIISQRGRNILVKQSLAENFNNFQAVRIDYLKYSNVNGIYVHTLFLLFPNYLPWNFRCSFKIMVIPNACKESFNFWLS